MNNSADKNIREISKNIAPLNSYHFFRVILSSLFGLIILFNQYSILPVENVVIAENTIILYFFYSVVIYLFKNAHAIKQQLVVLFALIDLSVINLLLYLSTLNNLLLILSSVMIVMIAATLSQKKYSKIIALQATILLSVTHILYLAFKEAPISSVITSLLAVSLSYFLLVFVTSFLNEQLQSQILQTQKKNKEALQFRVLNKRIIEQMRTGILVLDENLHIVMFNNHSQELLNISLKEDINIKEFSHHIHLALTQPEKQNHIVFNNTISSPDTRASFSSLEHNNTEFTLIYLENNTKIHAKAQEYKLSSLGRLTASIAHEIRNPLSAITYANQCLIEESSDSNKDQAELTSIIRKNSDKINLIITDILNLARSPQTNRKLINLHKWTPQFIEQLQQSHPEKLNIETIIPKETTIRFDPNALELVLTNICENGIHFSKLHTGEAKLTIKASVADNLTSLTIRDYGLGVHADDIDKLFEPFFTTRKGGTGLGLYITQQLCQINLATIKYSLNQHDASSNFIITFTHQNKVNNI